MGNTLVTGSSSYIQHLMSETVSKSTVLIQRQIKRQIEVGHALGAWVPSRRQNVHFSASLSSQSAIHVHTRQRLYYPGHAHVRPGLVVGDHQVCGGHRAVPRQWWSRPEWRATTVAWRRGWYVCKYLLQIGSATRPASFLAHSNPSPSSHVSAMVRLVQRDLILTQKKREHLLTSVERTAEWVAAMGCGWLIWTIQFHFTLFLWRLNHATCGKTSSLVCKSCKKTQALERVENERAKLPKPTAFFR